MKKSGFYNESRLGAFTLIEMMVVVSIMILLAALIVPALQKAQAKALTVKCISKAKAIASSIRAYAAANEGWTIPDVHAMYIRDAGYKLASEVGYFGEAPSTNWAADPTTESYQYAVRDLREFVCPADEDPRISRHAVPSSYSVVRPFTGLNIMDLTGSADQTLCVVEAGGNRHHKSNGDASRVFVYADMHSTFGFNGQTSPGLLLKVWNRDSESGILRTAYGELPGAEHETLAASLYFGGRSDDWTMALVGLLDAAQGFPNDWNNAVVTRGHTGPTFDGTWVNNIERVVARVDGFIKFPANGTWDFRIRNKGYYTYQWFAIAEPGDIPFDARSRAKYTNVTNLGRGWGTSNWSTGPNVDKPGMHYPFQHVYRSIVWSGGHHLQGGWEIHWRRLDPGTGAHDPAYGGTNGQRVPDNVLSTLPF